MIRNTLLFAASILLSIVAAESVIRAWYGHKFAPRPSFWVLDEELGWRLNANLDSDFFDVDYKIHIRTDENGYRLGELGKVDETSGLVLLVGDSYTLGWGVDDNETFHSYLDKKLSRTGTLRAVNLGVDGYGTIQSQLMLKRFLSRDRSSRTRAIIILHSSNDPTDNVRFALFQNGNWGYQNLPSNESPLFLINLVRQYGVRLVTQTENIDDIALQHGFPSNITTPPSEWIIDGQQVYRDDISSRRMRERESLTSLQRILLQEAVKRMNCSTSPSELIIIHAVTPYRKWFEPEVKHILSQTESCGNRIEFVGRIEIPSTCPECGENDHSGEHFNPPMNRYYADYFFDLLVRTGVIHGQ